MKKDSSTIVALSTPTGGALCVIRLSGVGAVEIVGEHFEGELGDRRASYGVFRGSDGEVIDEVVVTCFLAPRSYTGEDVVEISAHGSPWIASEIIRTLIGSGAVAAGAGEFSKRALLGGKMNLSEVEAVADLIASESRAAARVALQQLRGGYSEEFSVLRGELLELLSLLELELDFGEEDVEFADRGRLVDLTQRISDRVEQLRGSFRLGNVLKSGVPVAIVGAPNVGKSTLLNRLVGEDRAIVSSVAGTTRDFIEASVVIGGVMFRFIDTAGLRSSDDEVEMVGVARSYEQLERAQIVLHMRSFDVEDIDVEVSDDQVLIDVYNKVDMGVMEDLRSSADSQCVMVSARFNEGLEELREALLSSVELGGGLSEVVVGGDIVVSNVRHYSSLCMSSEFFERALGGMRSGLPSELISFELRGALFHLGEITGDITTDDILGQVFSTFCIGK